MEKDKKEISPKAIFLKLFIAFILINLIIYIIDLLGLLILDIINIAFDNNLMTYLGIFNKLLSSILAVKIISKKYILKDNVNIFVNKIILFFIIFYSITTILTVCNEYRHTISQLKICDYAKATFEIAERNGEEIELYKENL